MPVATPAAEATVLAWKPLVRNSMRGFFSLQLPSGLIIHELILFEKEGKRWVGLPSRPYDKNGSKQYAAIIEIPDRDRRDKFILTALNALDRYFASHA